METSTAPLLPQALSLPESPLSALAFISPLMMIKELVTPKKTGKKDSKKSLRAGQKRAKPSVHSLKSNQPAKRSQCSTLKLPDTPEDDLTWVCSPVSSVTHTPKEEVVQKRSAATVSNGYKASKEIAERIIQALSKVETQLATVPCSPSDTSWFYCESRPKVSVARYLRFIIDELDIQLMALVYAVVYIDKVTEDGRIDLNILTIHRLVLTAVMLGSKYTNDFAFCSVDFAEVGRVALNELNKAEVELLSHLNFSAHLSQKELRSYTKRLIRSKEDMQYIGAI